MQELDSQRVRKITLGGMYTVIETKVYVLKCHNKCKYRCGYVNGAQMETV